MGRPRKAALSGQFENDRIQSSVLPEEMEQGSSKQGLEAGAIQLSADSLHFGFGRIGEDQKGQVEFFEQNASRHGKNPF
jgi:hypothetical protein